MASLLCRPDQLPVPQEVRIPPHEAVASRLAAQITEGPLHTGESGTTGESLLAAAGDPAPVAEHAFCRQTLKVGASCPSGLAGICAGGVG